MRSAQLRRRRRVCLLATRVGLVALGILAVLATITYARVGSLSGWYTVGVVTLLACVGAVVAVAAATPCPSCGRIPDPGWHFGRYSVPSRLCAHCGADLYAHDDRRSE